MRPPMTSCREKLIFGSLDFIRGQLRFVVLQALRQAFPGDSDGFVVSLPGGLIAPPL